MPSRLTRTATLALLLLLCLGAAGAAATTPHVTTSRATTSTAGLAKQLNKLLGEAGGSSSGYVVDEDTDQVLYSSKATTARLPASVEKLFTTSAALFQFGSNGRFQTRLYGVGTLSNGVFSGKLYLRGGGDPTFGDSHFNATHYGTGANVQSLITQLKAAGVKQIKGSIIGDASIFDTKGGGPDTGYRANLETEGELSGLAYDAGFTTGSETRLQSIPALWAAQALESVAASNGIRIARGTKVTTGTTPSGATLMAKVSSPTVATILKLTNAPSDNFFAETLEKDLGAAADGVGTTADGASTVESIVTNDLGLSERTNDGSGLSRYDRTTAVTVVNLLQEMQPSLAFYNSLAVAGRSGTMIDEMLGTPAANNCRGKTGTLHDVANLVGYCVAANGDRLAFAFLENGLRNAAFGHDTEDVMGETLAAYAGDGQGTQAPAVPQPNAGSGVPSVGAGFSGSSTSSGSSSTTTTSTTTTTPSSPGVGGGGF